MEKKYFTVKVDDDTIKKLYHKYHRDKVRINSRKMINTNNKYTNKLEIVNV